MKLSTIIVILILLGAGIATFVYFSKQHSAGDGHDHQSHSADDGHKHDSHSADDGHDHGKKVSSHGAAGAVPGSYEDWCGEHAVPESKCTRCDPKLAAAFKATGDWCVEHGLPESHCVQCDPKRKMTRPPKK